MNSLLIPDVSHYEAVDSFHEVAAIGCPAVILKASQGTHNVDPTYEDDYARAKQSGLVVGAYHYLEAGDVPVQIAHFLATAHLVPGDLRPIVDAEAPGLGRADTEQALDLLATRGLRPILYASASFWRDVLGSPTDHALWLAAYRPTMPALPTGVTLFAWQFTDRGVVKGIPSPCDCSHFYGDLAALKAYCLA